jgi:membrane-associated phospholipid phosphatase
VKLYYKILISALAAFGLAAPAAAQTDAGSPRSVFTWRDGVLAGGFIVGTLAIRPLDKSAANALQTPDRQRNQWFQRGAKFVRIVAQPGSTVIGLTMYGAGRAVRSERLAEVGLRGTEALVIGSLTGTVLKDFFGRARPFVDTSGPNPDDWQIDRGFRRGDRYQSFPSGHTTAAFAAAAAVSAETSQWGPALTYFGIGPVMYGGAAAVGLSRMYNNRHWASDVIMGAAIGTFAGLKVVRYHRAHPDSRFDKALLDVSWNPATGHLGFSILPGLGLPTRKR